MTSNESNHDAMGQSSNPTSNGSHNKKLVSEEPDADAVLKFLRKRGLDAAFLQVQRHLETEEDAFMGDERKKIKNDINNNNIGGTRTSLYREEEEEEKEDTQENKGEKEEKQNDADQQSSVLLVATDAESAVVVPGTNDRDEHATLDETHSTAATLAVESLPGGESQMDHTLVEDRILDSIDMQSRQEEARRCFKAFTAFQSWSLNLPDDNSCTFDNVGNDGDNDDEHKKDPVGCFLPGSIKPEVLHVTFPLFCYTYCNLLENHLEHTASVLLSTFQHVHEPRYPMEFRDLEQCYKVEHVENLKKLVMEARGCLCKMKASKKSCDECREQIHGSGGGSSSMSGKKDSITKAMETLNAYETEYKESINQYKALTNRLKGFPFLSRALFMKCYLNISATTFGYLVRYLRSDDMLLPMSLLLQSKCRVVVEKRRPLPFVPVCVLEDIINVNNNNDDDDDGVDNYDVTDPKPSVLKDIQWAAPMDPLARSNELGDLEVTVMKNGQSLPFPKLYLNQEYETAKDYKNEKRCVEFNRSLLTNGFRRLAALELKYEYECGLRGIVEPGKEGEGETMGECGNPLEPSVLLSTLCTSFDLTKTDDSKIQLEEAGVEINCAKLSPVDGRFVAAGCSDSAVRIWSADSWESLSANGSIDTAGGVASTNPAVVLLGHKRGLPVFDLDWNRDGRTLISAGGDGSLRLWDTRAVGSVGETTRIGRKEYMRQNGTKSNVSSSVRPITHVPGAKAESTAHRHGSALVCYQGHSPMTPIWSVSVAPCGYYFASAGADSTARLWCTDRKTPVRIFAGHSSENVNTVSWHPNCNYILTGSDDRTVRMWDIQSGKCVRLFNGCPGGVNQVKVSYSGLCVAGVDYSGVVHLWDVRNGKKLNEFRCSHSTVSGKNNPAPIVRSMCFSRCGTAIATGSDDCAIRIWDSRNLGNHCNGLNTAMHLYSEPNRIIRTKRTSVLDLHYTKQNLLLTVGKYFEI